MLRDGILMARRKSRPLTGRFVVLPALPRLLAVHCEAVSFTALNKQTNKQTFLLPRIVELSTKSGCVGIKFRSIGRSLWVWLEASWRWQKSNTVVLKATASQTRVSKFTANFLWRSSTTDWFQNCRWFSRIPLRVRGRPTERLPISWKYSTHTNDSEKFDNKIEQLCLKKCQNLFHAIGKMKDTWFRLKFNLLMDLLLCVYGTRTWVFVCVSLQKSTIKCVCVRWKGVGRCAVCRAVLLRHGRSGGEGVGLGVSRILLELWQRSVCVCEGVGGVKAKNSLNHRTMFMEAPLQ
jgi:hypothetical protein